MLTWYTGIRHLRGQHLRPQDAHCPRRRAGGQHERRIGDYVLRQRHGELPGDLQAVHRHSGREQHPGIQDLGGVCG